MARALMFRAGVVRMICAGVEVEITPGSETHKGSITPVRDCVNLATERVQTGDCYTGLCPTCAEWFANSPQIGSVEVTVNPENN